MSKVDNHKKTTIIVKVLILSERCVSKRAMHLQRPCVAYEIANGAPNC